MGQRGKGAAVQERETAAQIKNHSIDRASAGQGQHSRSRGSTDMGWQLKGHDRHKVSSVGA